jgi:hypothetical protein
MKAPIPTIPEPATARIVAAAPVEAGPSDPVALPLSSPSSLPPLWLGFAPVPVGVASVPVALLWPTPIVVKTIVVLLFAETTIVCVLLTPAVPCWTRVTRPVPMAGMEAASPTEVASAGMEVSANSAGGCEVATEGIPVTTPRELVWVRKEVCGWASSVLLDCFGEGCVSDG